MSYDIELKNELRSLRAEVSGLRQDTVAAGKTMGDALRSMAGGTKQTRSETDKLRDQMRSMGQEGRRTATVLYEGFGVQLKAALLQVNLATMGIQYGMQLVSGVVDGVRAKMEATAKAAREMNGEMQKAVGTRARQAGEIMKAGAAGVAPADTQKALKAFAEGGGDVSNAGIMALTSALPGITATGMDAEQFAKLFAAATGKKGGRLDPQRAAALIFQAANQGAGALKELEGAKPNDWRRRDRQLATTAQAEIERAVSAMPADEVARRAETVQRNRRTWRDVSGDLNPVGQAVRWMDDMLQRPMTAAEQQASLTRRDINAIDPGERRRLLQDAYNRLYRRNQLPVPIDPANLSPDVLKAVVQEAQAGLDRLSPGVSKPPPAGAPTAPTSPAAETPAASATGASPFEPPPGPFAGQKPRPLSGAELASLHIMAGRIKLLSTPTRDLNATR